MSIKELNNKLIILGDSVLAAIKYEINFKYSVFDFFKTQQNKSKTLEKKLLKYLYSQ